jgi:glycosyltransferase involved in cell wall biosynthesis
MPGINIICFSINNWEKRKARKQQFMEHLSQRDDIDTVIYVEPALNLWRLLLIPWRELRTEINRARWVRALSFSKLYLSPKLIIVTPVFILPGAFRVESLYNLNQMWIAQVLKRMLQTVEWDKTVLWLYHPYDCILLKLFRVRALSVFDWAEYWSEFFTEYSETKKKKIETMEHSIVSQVDVVFTVSQRLLHIARTLNANAHQLLDGTIPSLFSTAGIEEPEDLRALPRPIVLYVGTIYHRVDLELLALLSEQIPSCSIVLVGNIQISHEQQQIINKPNIILTGVKEYHMLPAYFAYCSVCILPYIAALVSSPATKVFDYLASGKAIVSTDLPEMDQYAGLISVTKTHQAFVDAVKTALTENDPVLSQKRQEFARCNSWTHRAHEILSIIMSKIEQFQ